MCNGTGDFGDSPAVINGYSELIKEVFGHEKGTGARSAVTMGSLPNNMAVEVEAIFQLVRPAKTPARTLSRAMLTSGRCCRQKSDYGSSKL